MRGGGQRRKLPNFVLYTLFSALKSRHFFWQQVTFYVLSVNKTLFHSFPQRLLLILRKCIGFLGLNIN